MPGEHGEFSISDEYAGRAFWASVLNLVYRMSILGERAELSIPGEHSGQAYRTERSVSG